MAYDGTVKIGTDLDSGGAEKGLKDLARVVRNSAIVAAIGAMGKAIVGSYADYEQLVGGVDTLFKASSAKLQEYAANAYKSAGLSANAYMETVTSFSASLIQSLGGDTEKAVSYADTAVTDMADNANKFGTAMDAIQFAYQGFAKQNFTMLDNLKLGYGGTKTEMERLLADAEKLSGLEFDISSFADITRAIHVVQESMGVAGATAAEAEGTITGSINALKGAWANLLTGLGDSNADVAKLAGNVVKQFKTVAKNVLPVLDNITDSIPPIKLIKQFAPAILTVAAAVLAYNVAKKAQIVLEAANTAAMGKGIIASTVMAAKNVITTASLVAMEIASHGLAAAMKMVGAEIYRAMGPVGLAAIAVTALVGALGYLITSAVNGSAEYQKLTETARNSAGAMKEIEATYSDSAESAEANAFAASQLVGELARLEAQGVDTAEEQRHYAGIVEQIKELYPELSLVIDENTGLVKDGTEAILANIDALREQAVAAAFAEKYSETLKEQGKVKFALYEAQNALNKSEARQNEIFEELARASGTSAKEIRRLVNDVGLFGSELTTSIFTTEEAAAKYSDLASEAYNLSLAIGEQKDAVKTNTDVYDGYNVTLEEAREVEALFFEEMAAGKEAMASTGEDAGNLSEDIQALSDKYGVAAEEIQAFVDSGGDLEEWAERQDAAVQKAEETLGRLTDAYYNMNETIDTSNAASLEERIANITANQAAVEAYAANLAEIGPRAGAAISDGLWEAVQAGDADAMALAQQIVDSLNAGDGKWAELSALYGEDIAGALGTVAENMDLDGESNPAQAAIDNMALTFDEDTTVETAAEGVVSSALVSATSKVAALDFSQVGRNMIAGIVAGISGSAGNLTAAIAAAIAGAHAGAMAADDQHSPSKWWERFGLNDMRGFALGIEGGAALVRRAQSGVIRGLQAQMTPVYAKEGINPGYGSVVNNYNMTLNTHDSLSPHEQTQEFRAMAARGGFQLQ